LVTLLLFFVESCFLNRSIAEDESVAISHRVSTTLVPVLDNMDKNNTVLVAISYYNPLKGKLNSIVYLLCIWEDGTILWNWNAINWIFKDKKKVSITQIPVKYYLGKIGNKDINKYLEQISLETTYQDNYMFFDMESVFIVYFQQKTKFFLIETGVWPSEKIRTWFTKKLTLFDLANQIFKTAISLIPRKGYKQIKKEKIRTKEIQLSPIIF
jgi:hypothetical protein